MYTNIDNFIFKLNKETSELHIIGYKLHTTEHKGEETEINIAPIYNIDGQNYKVTRIENTPIFPLSCKKIMLPNTINFIGKNTFQFAENLEEIKVDDNNEKYCSINGVLYNKKQTILIKFPAKKNIEKFDILDTIKTIKEEAFTSNNFIREIKMNDNVKSIEAFAFSKCKKLSKIKLSDNLTIINRRVFNGCEKLSEINFPKKLEKIAAYAFEGTSNFKKFKLDSKITLFGHGIFANSGIKEFITDKDCKIKYLNQLILSGTNLNLLYLDSAFKYDLNALYNAEIKNLYFSNNYDTEELNLTNIRKLTHFAMVDNIYINKFSDEIKDIDKIKEYCDEHYIKIIFPEELNILETKFDFQQINQIIKGYEKGLLLNHLPSSLSHVTFRDLIQIWESDKQQTLCLIDKLKNSQSLEELIETNKLISELAKNKTETILERGER